MEAHTTHHLASRVTPLDFPVAGAPATVGKFMGLTATHDRHCEVLSLTGKKSVCSLAQTSLPTLIETTTWSFFSFLLGVHGV